METNTSWINNNLDGGDSDKAILSQETYYLAKLIVMGFSQPIAVFGMVGNVINVIVYVRMGFSDSTNISLLALALTDIGIVFSSEMCATFFLLPDYLDMPVESVFSHVVFAWPHAVLTRTSACITAFLSLERCLCVLLPLKIKRLITPVRTFWVMIFIYTITLVPSIPLYFKWTLGWIVSAERNRSVIGIIPVDEPVVNAAFTIMLGYYSIVLPLISYIMVLLCTIFLIITLNKGRKWREANMFVAATIATKDTNTAAKSKAAESNKQTRTVKMVVAIATLFIVCSTPVSCHIGAAMAYPAFDIAGTYVRLFTVLRNACFVINAINSSANIIIYYSMSSKYKFVFIQLFYKEENHSGPQAYAAYNQSAQ